MEFVAVTPVRFAQESIEHGTPAEMAYAVPMPSLEYRSRAVGVRPETVTVLFTDVVGSTAWRVRVGGRSADQESAELERASREVVASSGGTVVKSVGDGVMATFTSALLALDAAVALQVVARRMAIGGAEEGLRIGISSGDMVRVGSDWVGTAAIEASRLCAQATGGSVLVADSTVQLSRGRSSHNLRSIGPQVLRGFDDPIGVHELIVAVGSERPLPSALAHAGGELLVGREGELARADTLLDRARSGASGTLLILGEPGVGKTRLVAAVAAAAQTKGFTVLFGRCDEGIAAPYRPVIEAFGPWLEQCPDALLTRLLGPGDSELAQLWPDLAGRAGLEHAALEVDPESRRWRLLEAVAGLVGAVTTERPLLFVLDDLHWAEPSTRLVLEHVVRRQLPGCVVVATARRAEPGPDPVTLLGELSAKSPREIIELVGLDEREVAELVTMRSGDRPPSTLCELLRRTTAGNPFFLTELLTHLKSVAHVRREDGTWITADELVAAGIPSGVRDVIQRRLRLVAADVRQTLDVAAIVGLAFEERTVRGVTGVGLDDAVQTLDAAAEAGLVVEIDAGRFAFVHALVRQSVLDNLSETGRARVHWRVAEQLERLDPRRVGEIGYHYEAGRAVGDPGTVVRAALAAADGAIAGAAFEEAAEHARAALTALDHMPSDPRLRFRALRCLGVSLNAIADGERSGPPWLEAADIARDLGDPEALFATVVGFGYLIRRGDDAELVRMLDDVLDLIGADDTPLRACALGWRAVPAFPGAGSRLPPGDRDMVEQAVAMARRTGDHEALAMTLKSRLLLESYSADAAGMLRDIEEIEAIPPTIGVLGVARDTASVFRDHATALLRVGRVEEADPAIARAKKEAARNGLRMSTVTTRLLEAGLACARGRFTDTHRIAAEGMSEAGTANPLEQLAYSAHIVAAQMEQGRLTEIIGPLRAFDGSADRIPAWTAMLVSALADNGELEEASARFGPLIDNQSSGFAVDFAAALAIRHLTETCRQLDDADRAAALLPHVEPWAGQLLVVAATATIEGTSDRCIGHLLATLGRYDDADAAYSRAAALERAGQLLPHLARTEYWHARALHQRAAPGDRHRAQALLDDVLNIAERIGMALLATQARRSAAHRHE
jgi:class 3 adenylate cyclase/tetratricopeptide (TPR) repeat protein